MSSRNITLFFVCLTLLVVSFSNSAQASRRGAMGGNLLIEDQDDIFVFPQLVLKYRDMIGLDYGPGDDYDRGNAVMLLGGKDAAFGLALHRGDLMSPELAGTADQVIELRGTVPLELQLNGVQSEYDAASGASFQAGPATMFDLLFAFGLAPDMPLGFRLGFGRGSDFSTTDGDDTGGGETFIMVEGGLSSGERGKGLRVDLSLDVLLDFADDEVGGTDTYSGMSIKAGHTGRGFYPLVGALELGFLWGLGYNNNSVTAEADPNPSYVVNRFNVAGGIGPAITLGPATIAGYALIGLDMSMTDPNSEADDDNSSDLDFFLPGALMSLEAQLAEWFYARTSAGYQYIIGSTSNDLTDEDTSTLSGQFLWTAGIGLEFGDFAFDGTFQSQFITDGPDFIGGNPNGFLAMASVTYNFDLHASSAQSTEEVEPPEVEPEPVAPDYPEPSADAEGSAEGDAAASGEAGAEGGAAVEAEGGISGQMKMGL